MRAAIACILIAVPSSAFAQNAAPACGVDCTASLGSCTGEAFCGSFRLNGGATVHIRNVYVLTGAAVAMAEQFDLEVFNENFVAMPGARIAGASSNSYGMVGNPSQFQQI